MTFLVSLFFVSLVTYANKLVVTESDLVKLSKKQSPTIDSLESKYLSSQISQRQFDDQYTPNFYAYYGHVSNRQKPIITFQPIFSPSNTYSVGINQKLAYGITADLSYTNDTRSSESNIASYKDLTTVTYALTLSFDLWKDFMGRISKKQIENLALDQKRIKIETEVSKQSFAISLRKIYWALLANQQKIKITSRLLDLAEVQLKDASRRYKKKIADIGEVSRYRSQFQSRKASILYLKYEKENLIENLKRFLPDLAGKDIDIANLDVDQVSGQVFACSTQISKLKEIPYEYTKYDEIIKFLRDISTNQLEVDSTYSDVDLSLNTTFLQTGVGSNDLGSGNFEGSYNDAVDDLEDNNRSGFEASVSLVFPIGGKKGDTEEVKKIYTKKFYESKSGELDLKLRASHDQIMKNVVYLQEIVKTQKINSKQLSISLKEMQKKFNQARVSVTQLVQDQDSLLQADITIVDSQLQIINSLLDYFSVFTDFPCDFNMRAQ